MNVLWFRRKFNPRYQNQQHGGHRRQNKHNQKPPQRTFEYRDLDDPKVSQVKTSRAIIDYADL